MEQRKDGSRSLWHDIIEAQENFNIQLNGEFKTDEDRTAWTKELALGLTHEIGEVLDELEWRVHHPKTGQVIDRQALLIECADVFKYSLSFFTTWGFTADEIAQAFWDKTDIVKNRYQQEYIEPKPIVAVDIDNVMCSYASYFIEWATGGKKVLPPKSQTTTELNQILGISREDYEVLKHQWRETGMKRTIPAFDGISDATKRLHDLGFLVVVITSRPLDEYKYMVRDTEFWLQKNDVYYDNLLFSSNKANRLIEIFGQDRIAAFIDDDPTFIIPMAEMGVPSYLVDYPYNSWCVATNGIINNGIHRVDSLEQAVNNIEQYNKRCNQ